MKHNCQPEIQSVTPGAENAAHRSLLARAAIAATGLSLALVSACSASGAPNTIPSHHITSPAATRWVSAAPTATVSRPKPHESAPTHTASSAPTPKRTHTATQHKPVIRTTTDDSSAGYETGKGKFFQASAVIQVPKVNASDCTAAYEERADWVALESDQPSNPKYNLILDQAGVIAVCSSGADRPPELSVFTQDDPTSSNHSGYPDYTIRPGDLVAVTVTSEGATFYDSRDGYPMSVPYDDRANDKKVVLHPRQRAQFETESLLVGASRSPLLHWSLPDGPEFRNMEAGFSPTSLTPVYVLPTLTRIVMVNAANDPQVTPSVLSREFGSSFTTQEQLTSAA